MVEKDYKYLVGGIKRVPLTLSPSATNPLYGTKIFNLKTQEIGLLICLWEKTDAFESYRKTQLNKYSWNFKDDNSLEFNFYFELHWNFNHFGISNWYIERM